MCAPDRRGDDVGAHHPVEMNRLGSSDMFRLPRQGHTADAADRFAV